MAKENPFNNSGYQTIKGDNVKHDGPKGGDQKNGSDLRNGGGKKK